MVHHRKWQLFMTSGDQSFTGPTVTLPPEILLSPSSLTPTGQGPTRSATESQFTLPWPGDTWEGPG